MLILDQALGGACPPQFLPMLRAIANAEDDAALCANIKNHCVWVYDEQVDLQHLVPLLNRLDAALGGILGEYRKSLILDSKGIEEYQPARGAGVEQAAEHAKIILDFTSMLLKNAFNKEVYASVQHLLAFTAAFDDELAALALEAVASLAVPPLAHRNMSDERHHQTRMHKEERLSEPIFDILRASCTVKHLPLKQLLTDFVDASSFSGFEFSCGKQLLGRQTTDALALSFRVDDVDALPQELPDALRVLVEQRAVPANKHLELMWTLRMARAMTSYDGRVGFVRQHQQAVVILLSTFPNTSVLASFFNDRVDIFADAIHLLQTGPGSADYDPSMPLEFRLLAVQALVALVATRDLSGSVMGRLAWIQHELGVQRGQYMGLLPCMLRASVSFLQLLSSDAALLDDQAVGSDFMVSFDYTASLNILRSLGGDEVYHGLQGTTSSSSVAVSQRDVLEAQPARAETSERLLWIEAILTLTSALLSSANTLAALVDCGLISLLLAIIRQEANPSRSNLHGYVEAQIVQVFEMAISHSSTAFAACRDQNGLEILVARLGKELELLKDYAVQAAAQPSMDLELKETSSKGRKSAGKRRASKAKIEVAEEPSPAPQTPAQQIPPSRAVLLCSLLSTISMYVHERAGTQLNSLTRSPTFVSAFKRVFDCADILGPTIVTPALAIVAEVINNEPSVLSFFLSVGLVTSALQAVARPREHAEWLQTFPALLQATSLTIDGTAEVQKHNVFPRFFTIFHDDAYVSPASRVLMGEAAPMLGGAFEELLRNSPGLKTQCITAVAAALRTLVAKGKACTSDACDEKFRAVLHHATNFATFFDQLAGRGGIVQEFVEQGGLRELMELVRVVVKPARYILSTLAAVTDDSQPMVGHSPALMYIFRCLMHAGREQFQMTFEFLLNELEHELASLPQTLSALDAFQPASASGSNTGAGWYAGLLHRVPSDVLPVVFRDSPDLLRAFAAVCSKHVVLKMVVDAVAALFADRVGAALRQDARRQVDELLQRSASMNALRTMLCDVYVSAHHEICRARGPLQHEFPSVLPRYTLLVTSLAESLPVRAEPNDKSEKLCRLERGTIVSATVRQLTADNMVRYRIEQGWVNSSKSRTNHESVLEVIDMECGEPVEAIDENAPLADKLRRRDQLQLANASPRRAGYVALATLSYSVGNLVRALANGCVAAEAGLIPGRQATAEIAPHVYQSLPIFQHALAALLPPTDRLAIEQVNVLGHQMERLPVTALVAPPLDQFSLADVSKVAEAVDFLFYLLSDSHRTGNASINPLMLTHILSSGLLEQLLRATVAVFLCCLKHDCELTVHAGPAAVLDSDLDTFPEGPHDRMESAMLSRRLVKERRKLARLQLLSIVDLWGLLMDCNFRSQAILNVLYDAADQSHDFDPHVLKRQTQVLAFKYLGSVVNHQQLWTLPTQSVKKVAELAGLMVVRLAESGRLSTRSAERSMRRAPYRQAPRRVGPFEADGEVVDAITSRGHQPSAVLRAMLFLQSNDPNAVTQYLSTHIAGGAGIVDQAQMPEPLRHLLPVQPRCNDATLGEQKSVLITLATLMSRSFPAIIVSLIERGVYSGSVRIGPDNQPAPLDTSREDMTAFLVQQLLTWAEQRLRRIFVAVMLTISTLTDSLESLLASNESDAMLDHKLYGVLHALLLLLAGKIHASFSTRSYSQDAVIYTTAGLQRTKGPLAHLASIVERRVSSRSAGSSFPAWLAPALLIFDVMCQPVVLPGYTQLRAMLASVRPAIHQAQEPADAALEEEISQFFQATARGDSPDGSSDASSADRSLGDLLSPRNPWESESMALRSLFALDRMDRMDQQRSGREGDRDRDRDTDRQPAAAGSSSAKPAHLPLTESSLGEDTLRTLFTTCQSLLSSPSELLTPPLTQAMLSLLVHLLRDLRLAHEFRQWNGSTKLLSLSAATRFPGINMTVLSALQQAADNENDLLQAMEHAIRSYVISQGNKRPRQPDTYQTDLKRFVERLSPLLFRNQELFFKALANTAKIVTHAGGLLVVVRESATNEEAAASAAPVQAEPGAVKSRKRRKSLSGGASEPSSAINPISDVVHVLATRVVQKWILGTASDDELQNQPEDLHAYSIMNASEALSTLAELVLSMPGFATCIHKCNVASLVPDWSGALQTVMGRERVADPAFVTFLVNGILTVPASSLECKQPRAEGSAEPDAAQLVALKRARLLGQDLHVSAKKLLLALCTRPGDGRRRTLQELLRALKVGHISRGPELAAAEMESVGHIVGCINDMLANKTSKYYAEFTEKLPAKEIIRQLVGLRAHVVLNELICILDVTDAAAAQLCVEITQPLEYLIRKGSVQVRIDETAAKKQAPTGKAAVARGAAAAAGATPSIESPFRRPRSFTDDDRLSGSEVETTEQLERTELPRRREEYEEDASSSDEEDEGEDHGSIDDLHDLHDLHDDDDDEEDDDGDEEEEEEEELDEEAEEFLQDAVEGDLVYDNGNVQFVATHVHVGHGHDHDDDEEDAGDMDDEGNERDDEGHDGDGHEDGHDGDHDHAEQPMDEGERSGDEGDGDEEDDHDGDDGDDHDVPAVRVVMNFNFGPQQEADDEAAAGGGYFERASSQEDDDGAGTGLEAEQIIEESEENAMEQLDDEGSNLDADEQDEDNSPLEVELPFGAEGGREVRYRADVGLLEGDEAALPNMIFNAPMFRGGRRGNARTHFLSLPRPRSPPTLAQARVTRPVRIRLGGEIDDVHALLFGADLEGDQLMGMRPDFRDRFQRHEAGLLGAPMAPARRDTGLRASPVAQLDPAFSDASDRRLEDHPLLQAPDGRAPRSIRARYAADTVGGVVSSLVGMLGGGGFRHRQRGSGGQGHSAADARWGMHGLNRTSTSSSADQLVQSVTSYIRSTLPVGPDVEDTPPTPAPTTPAGAEAGESNRPVESEAQQTSQPAAAAAAAAAAMDIDASETKDEGEQQETKQDVEEAPAAAAAESTVTPATETPMQEATTSEPAAAASAVGEATGISQPSAEAAPGLQCPPDVDPEVFAALPEEMQRELVEQHQSQNAAVSSLLAETSLDRDMLNALPDSIREEVLQEEAAERRRRESIDSAAAAAASGDPTAARAAADIEFITSLPPDLRRDALLTASDEFLRALPEDIQREAQELRQRFRIQNALEGMEPMIFGNMAAPRRYLPGARRQRAGAEDALEGEGPPQPPAPPVDPLTISFASNRKGKCPSGRLVLVQLLTMILRVPEGSAPRPLQRLLAALCRYEAARRTIVQTVVQILGNPHAMEKIRAILAFLPLDRRGALRAAKTTEQLEAMFDGHSRTLQRALVDRASDMATVRRLVGVLHYLCRKTDGLVSYEVMLPHKAPEQPGVDEWIFERLVQLLSHDLHDDASNFVEYVVQLLAVLFTTFEKLDITNATKLVELQVNPAAGEVHEEEAQLGSSEAASSSAAVETEPAKKKAKATSSSAAASSAEMSINVEVSPDQAQQDLTAMKQEASAEEELRVRLVFPILNPEMASHFCRLIASDHFHGATRKNLTHILQIASLYEGNWRLLLSRLQEIAGSILEQVMAETDLTLQVLEDILQQQGDSVVAMTAPQLANPSRVTELVLLQALQVMMSLRPSDEHQQRVVASYVGQINFGRLWDDLSECLDRVRKLEGLQDVAPDEETAATAADSDKKVDDTLHGSLAGLTMRFMPLIECFFLVVSATLQAQAQAQAQADSAERGQPRKRGRESQDEEDAKVGDDSKESEGAGEASRTETAAGAVQPSLDTKVQPYIPGERFRQSPEFQQMQMEVGSDPNGLRLVSFVQRNRALLNMVLRQNPQLLEGSFAPIIKIPKCRRFLHFDIKRAFFKSKMRKIKHAATRQFGTLRVAVRRSRIFEDSFSELRRASTDEMRKRLSVVFHGEEGVDAGGVTREWYSVLAREIFNENYALFRSTHDGVTFQPNPLSYVNKDHLEYFRFVGRIIGKAVCDGHLLDAHFTRSFYKHILGIPVTYHDVEGMDPEYYKSLQQILEYSLDDLGLDLTFSAESSAFGQVEIVDLIPDGRNIPVTDENKMDYVRLITHHRMTSSIQPQIDAFLEGFHELVPPELISIFNEHELELLISGLPDIDLEDLRANTEYHGYKATDDQIAWFWNALKSFSREEQALFLQFVTGTSKVPLDGFAALQGMRGPQKFNIHKAFGNHLLPSAHTCFNQLDLPSYSSEEELREKLLLAIKEGSEGFAFA